QTLVSYFPAKLRVRYRDYMPRHALRRDIVSTVIANTMINRTGSVFVHRMQEETGASSEEVTRAFILVRDIFDLEALWSQIDALDVTEVSGEQKKPVDIIATLYFALGGELEMRWISERITLLPTDTSWQALARNALRDDLAAQHRAITAAVAKLSPEENDPAKMMLAWKSRYGPAIPRLK